MKEGLKPGTTAEFTVVVTEDMLPKFAGEVVHPVMSTVSMIYYMEWAGRQVILPNLEADEEGSGFAVDIRHVGPAVAGQVVTFKAVCQEVTKNRVVCEVTADTARNRVGVGSFTQAIFNKHEIKRRFEALQAEIAAENNCTE